LGQEYSVRSAVAVDVQTNVASWWYRADRKVVAQVRCDVDENFLSGTRNKTVIDVGDDYS
jgi:hypothetical protein